MATLPTLPAVLSPALTGRDAIADALYRLVLGLDTNNKELFDSAFTQTASFTINERVSEGLPAIHTDCFDRISKMDTTHFLTNIRINIADSGTKATATASALAQHYPGGKGLAPNQARLLAGSLYYVDLVKDDASDLWKVQDFKMEVSWKEGDSAVMTGP